MLKYCSSSHIINCLLPHFILSWIHYSIKKPCLRSILQYYHNLVPAHIQHPQHPVSQNVLQRYFTLSFVVTWEWIQIAPCLIQSGCNGALICLPGLIRGDLACVTSPSFPGSQQHTPPRPQISQISSFRGGLVFSPVISLVESLPGDGLWVCSRWFLPLQKHQTLAWENRNSCRLVFAVIHMIRKEDKLPFKHWQYFLVVSCVHVLFE